MVQWVPIRAIYYCAPRVPNHLYQVGRHVCIMLLEVRHLA